MVGNRPALSWAEGSTWPPMGKTRRAARCTDGMSGRGCLPGQEEASARIKDSSVEAPVSPSWGDWRASKSLPAGGTFRGESAGTPQNPRLLPERAAPGPSGLPTWCGAVQEPDLFGVELAAAVLVPLGVDPHPEAVFPFRGVVAVAGPVVAFGAEVRQLGEAVMPPGHRPFTFILRAVTGQSALDHNPGDDLFHAGKVRGGGPGLGDRGKDHLGSAGF
jgi:hypothetical protein